MITIDIIIMLAGFATIGTMLLGSHRGLSRRLDDTNLRFDAVDGRFNAVDRKIEAFKAEVNTRFDAVDRRLEAVGGRFDAVDGRFNTVEGGFDAVDGRFNTVDRRFDAMDARFNQHFEAMEARLGRRFEAMDARFQHIEVRINEIVGKLADCFTALLAQGGTRFEHIKPVPIADAEGPPASPDKRPGAQTDRPAANGTR